MNIVIVTPQHVPVPECSGNGKDYIFFQSLLSEMKCVVPDLLILMPGCTEEQKEIAKDKTIAALNPKIIECK